MNIALNRFLLLYTRFDNKRVKSNPKLLLPTQPHQWESIKIRWPSTKYNKTVDWYPGEANKNSGDEQNDDHATVDPATHRNSGVGHFILIFPAQFSSWCENLLDDRFVFVLEIWCDLSVIASADRIRKCEETFLVSFILFDHLLVSKRDFHISWHLRRCLTSEVFGPPVL